MASFEKELIRAIRNGDQKSFELVFHTYFLRLCNFAHSYTKQIEVAEDLVKDVFVHLWDCRENLDIKKSLSGYLFRSVRNACINYLIRDRTHNNLSIEEINRQHIKISEPLSDDYPLGKILTNELEDRIYSEIEKLPDSCKQIFKLSRFEGMSHKKIAEKLKISENTVKVQIFRALKKLRETIYNPSILLFNFFLKK